MKNHYIQPVTESVRLQLFGSVMENGIGIEASYTDEGLAKENSDIVFDDDFAGDIWSDPNAGSNAYDLWGE